MMEHTQKESFHIGDLTLIALIILLCIVVVY